MSNNKNFVVKNGLDVGLNLTANNVTANTFIGDLDGNAGTATTLQTARTINGVSFNGSANITITANTPNTLTRGTYLTGNNFNGSAATTWAVDATTTNTASKVVARDASGNFAAGTITAALSGNATTATTLQTARTIGGVSFNGSANIDLPGVNTAGNQDTTGTAAVATTITLVATDTTDATHYPLFADAATGNENPRTDTGFTYNPSTGVLGSLDFNSTSDETLKENIKTIESAADKVSRLRGVNFNWKNTNKYAMGVIAQEVEKVIPEVVNEIDGIKKVSYGSIVGLLIEAINDQQKIIEKQSKRIAALEIWKNGA